MSSSSWQRAPSNTRKARATTRSGLNLVSQVWVHPLTRHHASRPCPFFQAQPHAPGHWDAMATTPPDGSGSTQPRPIRSNSSTSTEFDLIRLGPPGEVLHQLIRFDDGEDPFARGQAPFYCYQEKEEILPDADEPSPPAPGKAYKRSPRAPRAGVRWTLEDKAAVRAAQLKAGKPSGGPTSSSSPTPLQYHGKPLAGAPGTAYMLMVPNRASGVKGGGGKRREIFVVPLGPWIGYQRAADAVEGPASVKEAEAMMREGTKRGGGRKRKEEEEEAGALFGGSDDAAPGGRRSCCCCCSASFSSLCLFLCLSLSFFAFVFSPLGGGLEDHL